MRRLDIHADGHRVGALSDDNNLWTLEYDPSWAASDAGFDLSPALPRSTARHADGATRRPVQWYFDNLLPEEGMRRLAAQEAGIRDHEDAFALLEYLGAESAGALTLLPAGTAVPSRQALQALSHAALGARIGNLPRVALTHGSPKRMSAAGAQHKLLVVRKGNDLYEPIGATPSTHILKPDHPDKSRYPASAFLEYLTMRMAGAAGLPVPNVALLSVPEPVYVVERFDRVIDMPTLEPATRLAPPQVRRRHAIDACQLLDKSRSFKHSGATVHALREAAERTGNVLTLPVALFRWLVFNLLVANDDCHLKNLSFLVEPRTITLAPHYDLLATGAYSTRAVGGTTSTWPRVELGVRLGDDVRRFDAVTPEAVLAAGDVLGIPRRVSQREIHAVVTGALRHFDRFYAQHFLEEPGLMATSGQAGAADEEPAMLSGPTGSLGAERRLLRVLRYIILPEMRARLIPRADLGQTR